jgi:adenylate kinase family enzyme
MKRRRLTDLYVKGKEVEVSDGSGEPVAVWLQKLNGVDREACLRRANAAKAKFMIEADKEDSEIFQAMYAEVRDTPDREGLVGVVVAEEVARHRMRIEAQRAADEETWAKDNYLQGLIDAWIGDDDNPGLAATQAEYPDDPEVARVLAEIERFEHEVTEETRAHTSALLKDWQDVSDEELWRKASHKLLERRGNDMFNREFDKQQLFHSVREPDEHAKRYFLSVKEIDDLDESIVNRLIKHYGYMMVDGIEGKDSRASQPSSTSSDPSPAEEAQPPSGPEVATA